MPSLHYPLFPLPEMSDKKSPLRKEKPAIVRTPHSDEKGMKRKLLSPGSPSHNNDDDDKKTPIKRKRGSLSIESSLSPGLMTTPKTPGSLSQKVPLSERQQLAMIMRMSDECQGAPVTEQDGGVKSQPMSPTSQFAMRRTPLDKKVHKRNERGELPIHLAAIKGDVKLMKKLIKAGADVNVSDFAGWTPLHEACNHGWLSVAKQLLKAGANCNVQGLENDTPLHDAAGNGHYKLVELLLKHGANPLQPNAKGKTPMDVAVGPEMLRLLKRETITSGSESSSIDDARSPMSPDSVRSKDEDASLDVEDMNHQRTESFSSSSSVNNRRLSFPKSPDNKLSSPRLCLKFQRENGGQVNQKAKDSKEPQYKSYSVTSVTVDSSDNLMFSAGNSPESSIDSDIYNSMLDSTGSGFAKNRLKNDETVTYSRHTEGNGPVSMELSSEQGTSYIGRMNNKYSDFNVLENSNFTDKIGLKTIVTQPFSPHTNWSGSQKSDFELPDLDENSQSHIPLVEDTANHISELQGEDSVPSSTNGIFGHYQSNVSSSTGINNCMLSSTTNFPDSNNILEKLEKPSFNGFGSGTHTKSKMVTSQSDTVNNVTSLSETLTNLSSGLKWDLRSAASPKSEDGSVHSNKSDSIRTGSPSRVDKLDRESRPSTPKVPPLKIIIPPKSTASSLTELKVHVANKSALPYVINPTKNQEKEAESSTVADSQTEIPIKFVSSSRVSSPASQPRRSPRRSPSPTSQLRRSPRRSPSPTPVDQNKSSDKMVENDNDDSNLVLDLPSGDSGTFEKLNENKEVTKSETDGKKEETTEKRVLRSSVRSQAQSQTKQQQKQDKLEKLEKCSNADTASIADSTTTNRKDEDDANIPPRKRKLRQKTEVTSTQSNEVLIPLPITTAVSEKIPNSLELFLSLRKRVTMRQQGICTVYPKTPQGFKDYLLKTCNYVLQNKNSSTLSVPTLSPPNSVQGPMRDLFVQQEDARYNLRLQHLIERDKLKLSIEQEILREHGRAARALANQGYTLSVCTLLRDQEIYNELDLEQEEKEKKHRSRYNGRQFISWIQDVDDKYDKIKDLLILRQKQEADSLYAVQRMEWEWKLKELGQCDRNATPEIDELSVPLVQVTDNFDLLPT